MEAIRKIVKVQDHKVTVELPIDFTANEVEVIVLPIENEGGRMTQEAFEHRKIVFESAKGIFKHSAYEPTEDEYYNQ